MVDFTDLAGIEAWRLSQFEDIVRKINTKLLEFGKGWCIKPWQVAVTAELLEGHIRRKKNCVLSVWTH